MQRAKMLFKSTESSPPPPDILSFYKARIDDFERERADLLGSISRMASDSAEQHRLEQELRKRTEEVRELQKALSDAHAFLFEERQRLLTLQAENDELRLQEIEDRKRIQQLLGTGETGTSKSRAPFANYSIDALLLKVESLQAQLNEQKQLSSERIAALLEDRRIRAQEEEVHRQDTVRQLDTATAQITRLEEQLRQATKDYILAKRDKQAAEERAITCETALAQEQNRSTEEVTLVKRKADKEIRDVKSAAAAKLDDLVGALRKQVKAKEEEVLSLSSVHSSLKGQYEKRLLELEDKCSKLTLANRQLEQRRHLDMEGFAADITYLRKMLTAVDRKLHEMRLIDRLEDDERLDAILAHLRKKAPVPAPPTTSSAAAPRPPQQQGLPHGGGGGDVRDVHPDSDTSSVKGELAVGIQEIRSRVKGLEDRLSLRRKGIR